MRVLKFGGTSVGSVESLSKVKKIVESIPGQAVIVVSALGGFTDKLIGMFNDASHKNPEWRIEFESAKNRHQNIINSVVSEKLRKGLASCIEKLFNELEGILIRIETFQATTTDLDEVVSFGERMSSEIVASMVENGKKHDSLQFIRTEKWYDQNVADVKLTEKLIQEEFANLKENEKAIVPGFISRDKSKGVITNLGRGGSDFTGALIAAALDAEVLEIWTDVDGFMTADPRIVKEARVIDHLTFTESMELCSFGAKVIYPPTIFPVFHKKIPIKILNTFNPKAPGTLITDTSLPDDLEIKGVTALKGLSFQIAGSELSVVTPSSQTIYVSNLNSETIAAFQAESAKIEKRQAETPESLVAVAVVGKNMHENYRLPSRIIQSLGRQSIGVKALSTESETNLILILSESDLTAAIPHIHALLYPM